MIIQKLNEIRCYSGHNVTLTDNLKWTTPPLDWIIKINIDAMTSSDGRIGLAAIIRDSSGLIISVEINCISGLPNAFFGESSAALMGVKLLQGSQHYNIILELDALQVVQAIHSSQVGRLEGSSIIQDIRRALMFNRRWQVIHTPREGSRSPQFGSPCTHGISKNKMDYLTTTNLKEHHTSS